MYNYSGLIYSMIIYFNLAILIFLILFADIACYILSKKKRNHNKLNKKNLLALIVLIVICLSLGLNDAIRIVEKDVCVYTGEYLKEYRHFGLQSRYYFGKTDDNKVFYMDVFSKSEIYPYSFEEEEQYAIYYDRDTSIIVRVEPLQKNN